MPRFLDPNNAELNPLTRIKKIVNSRNKKKYEKSEPHIQGLLGGEDLYLGLSSRLTSINASLIEVSQSLILTADTLRPRGRRDATRISAAIADRYLTSSSNLIRLSKDALLFFKTRLRNNVNQFTGEQVMDIEGIMSSILNKEEIIEDTLDNLPDSETADKLQDIFDEYDHDLTELLHLVSNAVENYRQIQPVAVPTGGAISTALRVGLDFAPTFATADRNPPRNGEDFYRPSLPRRFQ